MNLPSPLLKHLLTFHTTPEYMLPPQSPMGRLGQYSAIVRYGSTCDQRRRRVLARFLREGHTPGSDDDDGSAISDLSDDESWSGLDGGLWFAAPSDDEDDDDRGRA